MLKMSYFYVYTSDTYDSLTAVYDCNDVFLFHDQIIMVHF